MKDVISNWEATLRLIKKTLNAPSTTFSAKAAISESMLDESLNTLAALGLLSKVAVVIAGYDGNGKHIVIQYSLGISEDGGGNELAYVKCSKLEEDE